MSLDRTKAPKAYAVENFRLLPAEEFELANGIKGYYMDGGSHPIANIQLVLGLGKSQERQQGQAFFMGKTVGEGTLNYTNQQLSEAFESRGAFWGISAGADWMEVSVLCLTKQLHQVLPLILELLSEATFPEKELENQKNITLQQHLVGKEKTSYLASVAFKEKLFGHEHPYGYSLNEQSIANINRDVIQEFYRKIPQLSGGMLFVAGKLEAEHIHHIKSSFEQLHFNKNIIDKSAKEEEAFVSSYENTYIEKIDAVQSSIKIGRTVFSKQHQDQITFQVLNTILGGYFGSRLMQNIREDKGLSYGIHSSVSFMKNRGIWLISSEVQKEKKELALSEIYKELHKLKTELVSEEELNLVKNYMAGSFVKAINSPTAQVNCHKSMALYQLPSDYYNRYIARIRQVEAQQLQRLANEHFTDDLLEVVVG